MASIRVTVRTGNNSKGFSSTKNPYALEIANGIEKEVGKKGEILLIGDGSKLAKELQSAADKKLLQVAGFIARNLIGKPSASMRDAATGGAPTKAFSPPEGGTLLWRPLSYAYRQSKTANKNKHFLHTGELRAAVAASAGAILNGIGQTKVQVVAEKQNIKTSRFRRVASLRVTIAPRGASVLPALRTGKWLDHSESMGLERRIFSPSIVEKLTGPSTGYGPIPGHHRPLMQPIISYWILFKVPAELNKIIRRKLYRETTAAVGDYSVRN